MYSQLKINEKIRNESGIDNDWFFTDEKGNIAIVASAGGLLPDSVANHLEEHIQISNYFRALPIISEKIHLQEELIRQIKNFDSNQVQSYLKDVYFMVQRGLYYFDKFVLNDYMDFKYFMKAKPSNPLLSQNINDDIYRIIINTQVKGNLSNIEFLYSNEIS